MSEFLDHHFSKGGPGSAIPARLLDAIRHGVLNGGKRFRPFLTMEAARLFRDDDDLAAALPVAAALECIHCYSLIHDDLPAMDDDDLRRGQPTVHKAFDEATAILAGDALLTEAFSIVSGPNIQFGYESTCRIVQILAVASGAGGMVGGQMLDIENENKNASETMIIATQRMKTGALIRAACEAGAVAANAPADGVERLIRFGDVIGLAFQLADDLLDETADAATMGKRTGKDADAGKRTLVSLHGHEWARAKLQALADEASSILAPYGARAEVLYEAARFVTGRGH